MAASDTKTVELLRHHLPYEIDMFRATYIKLCAGIDDWATKNAFIESFFIHARTLLEFFSLNPNAWPVTGLCDRSYEPLDKAKCMSFLSRVSNQIVHLGAMRVAAQERKLDASDPSIARL